MKTKQKSRTGGKGSVRRKTKRRTHSSSSDDKRLQNTLKRLGVNNIPAIEEVNLFKDNGTVIHFSNPKVQASIGANTYVISGRAENKSKFLLVIGSLLSWSIIHCLWHIRIDQSGLQELLPGILNQLGPDNLTNLKKIAESYQVSKDNNNNESEDSDDDVPDLVENFEDVSNATVD